MLSTDMNDWSLLRQYVERRSEAAFESLVRRHLDMVYSAAWRQAGDASLAEEVAQEIQVKPRQTANLMLSVPAQ